MTAEHDTLLKHLRGVQHIVINDCHGGFGLSAMAIERYHDIMNRPVWIETNRMCSLVKTVWLVPLDQRVELPGPKEWQTMTGVAVLPHTNFSYQIQNMDSPGCRLELKLVVRKPSLLHPFSLANRYYLTRPYCA